MTGYLKYNEHEFNMPNIAFLENGYLEYNDITCHKCGIKATIQRKRGNKPYFQGDLILKELEVFGIFVLWKPEKECLETIVDNIL